MAILFFVIVNFVMISFILVISVLVFFFSDTLPIIFIDMPGFVDVMKFWYVCTLYMPEVFYFVAVFHASCEITLVLVF